MESAMGPMQNMSEAIGVKTRKLYRSRSGIMIKVGPKGIPYCYFACICSMRKINIAGFGGPWNFIGWRECNGLCYTNPGCKHGGHHQSPEGHPVFWWHLNICSKNFCNMLRSYFPIIGHVMSKYLDRIIPNWTQIEEDPCKLKYVS